MHLNKFSLYRVEVCKFCISFVHFHGRIQVTKNFSTPWAREWYSNNTRGRPQIELIAHYVSTCNAEQQPLFKWESWEGNQGSPSTLPRRWKEQITMPTLHSIAKWHIRDIMSLTETLHSLQSKERAAKEQWILLACSRRRKFWNSNG